MGLETIFDGDLLSFSQISEASGFHYSWIVKKINSENIPVTQSRVQGGIAKLVAFKDLPNDLKTPVILTFSNMKKPSGPEDLLDALDKESAPRHYTVDHDYFDRKSEKQKAEAYRKAEICGQYQLLTESYRDEKKHVELMKVVAKQNGMKSWRTLQNWWHGKKGKPGVKHYDRIDWAAALVNGFAGRQKSTSFSQKAFDYYSSLFLDRRMPSYADCFRRTVKAGLAAGWIMASEKTFRRHIEELSRQTIVLYREGEEAMRRLFPFQHRDKTCFKAGEAVTGDGLKFDKIYVEFPDGEILNTCTGWLWQDIYSGKILACRLAKTENTDVFRLATYDLLETSTPYYMQIDNTRAAANKVMTAHIAGRHRFKDLPTDAPGILYHLGIDAHFTNPDHKISNPGVKPIERAFGGGGIHEKVANNPACRGRGFSKKTAIPFEEFEAIVEAEIISHNQQKKRRSDVCQGLYSFDEVFEKSFATAAPRKSTEQQRTLLLMLQEQVKCANNNGMITIQAGKGPGGKNRYWCDELSEFAGQNVVAFYDPNNLHSKASIYSMDCRYLFDAEWQPSVAFNDTDAAREHAKNIQRKRKAAKLVAKAEKRMGELEIKQYSPNVEPPEAPETKVVTGIFDRKLEIPETVEIEIDMDTGEVINAESLFSIAAKRMDDDLQEQLKDQI